MHKIAVWLALVLLAPIPGGRARAQPASIELNYAAFIAGLNAADVQASIALSPQQYRLHLSYRLTGLVGAIVHAEGASTVSGRFQDSLAQPASLFTSGHFRGRLYLSQVTWQDGQPTILQQMPAATDDREPVPAALQANTVDTLSAVAALLRQVARTGRCDGERRTFDGRRLFELRARTIGTEDLPETSRSSFKGIALRCDFEGRQLAGFLRDGDEARQRRPQHGTAWFARLSPGTPPVPVRITFDARSFGEATLFLAAPG